MQGLILAAGKGVRLGKYTEGNTKCMVEVNGKTLIERALDKIVNIGIKKTIIVIGYQGEKLRQFIGVNYKGMEIVYVENEVYDKTNNIYSLWIARQHLAEDDTLLLESDIIFEEGILYKVIQAPEPNLAVVSKFELWMDGTVTILDEKDNIISFLPKKSFDWNNIKNYYKTVNIYKFSKEFSEHVYIPFLEAYVKALGKNEYYEQVLRVITYLDGMNFKGYRLTNEKWYEIDDVQDLDIAEVLFSEEEDGLAAYQKRYGGYWRFTRLKDFCYLVNPYFPDEKMLDEFKSNFYTLISQYPSGLRIQNLLAGKLFGCDTEEIVVGNGAAELIKILAECISGQVGVIFPTFNEYPERIGYDRVKRFQGANDSFDYSVADLKNFVSDVNALVLVNPDNPSGHYFTKEEVLELARYMLARNSYLILDESFVDFAGEETYSLISSEILQEYPNLVVVKSISKSYGVPGLRLGVLATGNQALLQKIRANLPIWNINSFGEFFLQIIGKYKSEYKEACWRIAAERERFFTEISSIKYLRAIPSKANYLLCEVDEKISGTELTRVLLERYGIFIKDCSGKIGFEDKSFVRIAVRDTADNDYILEKLREFDPDDKLMLPIKEAAVSDEQ